MRISRYLFNRKILADDFATWCRPGIYGTAKYAWLNHPWYRVHEWLMRAWPRRVKHAQLFPARKPAIGDLVCWPDGSFDLIVASRYSITPPHYTYARYKPNRKPGINDYEWCEVFIL